MAPSVAEQMSDFPNPSFNVMVENKLSSNWREVDLLCVNKTLKSSVMKFGTKRETEDESILLIICENRLSNDKDEVMLCSNWFNCEGVRWEISNDDGRLSSLSSFVTSFVTTALALPL